MYHYYYICTRCEHTMPTQDGKPSRYVSEYQWCNHCGTRRRVRVMIQIDQPDGSQIEVRA